MTLFIGLAIWFASCALGFWLLVRNWRRDLDVTAQDAGVMGLISLLGPVSVVVALMVMFFDVLDDKRVIWPRKS